MPTDGQQASANAGLFFKLQKVCLDWDRSKEVTTVVQKNSKYMQATSLH